MPERAELHIERPPHFRESPNERRQQTYPTVDYPSAAEIENYDETPVAVRDVDAPEPPTHEIQQFSTARYHVNDARLVHVAGREPNRRRLLLRNAVAGATVYIGRNQSDSISNMFPLTATADNHAELELWHQDDVWAICDTGDATDLYVANEFVPQEDV